MQYEDQYKKSTKFKKISAERKKYLLKEQRNMMSGD